MRLEIILKLDFYTWNSVFKTGFILKLFVFRLVGPFLEYACSAWDPYTYTTRHITLKKFNS